MRNGSVVGQVPGDYVEGYAAGWRDGPYDADKAWEMPYRDGMQQGRMHRIDDEIEERHHGALGHEADDA